MRKTRRLPVRRLGCSARRALQAACLWMAGAVAAVSPSLAGADILAARYSDPTTRYAHGVLGDAVEWGALEMDTGDRGTLRIVLPEVRVFEDVAPRLVDVDLDGDDEVVVVESHARQGARLAIYDADGLVDATPYIGTRFRWLAPIGAADMDGDGLVELAYIDRPHLAKTLRLWRFDNGQLTQIAALTGVTNHRIGEADIGGGLRTCDGPPMMIVASANWQRLIGVTFDGTTLTHQDLGRHQNRASFERALAC